MMDDTERSGASRQDDEDRPPAPAARAGDAVPLVEMTDPAGLLDPDDAAWIQGRALAALRLLGAGGEVRVRVVADAEMADAHLKYTDTPGTTDVLTFDLSEGPASDGTPGVLDADIMVCFDEGARRGAERGHETRRELLLYIIHGVLHCMGHDDHDDESFDRMHRAEDEIMIALGVGATFHAADERAADGAAT